MLNQGIRALVVLAALCGAAPIAAQSSPGVTFEMTMTAQDSGGTAQGVQRGRGWVTRERARIDMAGAPAPLAGGDTANMSIIVTILPDGTRDMAMLNHDRKEVMRPEKMMAELREMMQALAVRPEMSVHVTEFDVDTLGAGTTVDGFATRRYRVRMALTMAIAVMGERQEMRMSADQTGDYVPEFADYVDAMQSMTPLTSMASIFGGSPEFESTVRRMIEQSPKGLAVSSDARINMSGGMMGGHAIVQTMRLSSIRRADIPDSLFAIPADYTEPQMPTPGGGR